MTRRLTRGRRRPVRMPRDAGEERSSIAGRRRRSFELRRPPLASRIPLPAMRHRFHTADVFTTRRFGGNQLAVFPDARGIPEESLLPIAREFNYSETTFVF